MTLKCHDLLLVIFCLFCAISPIYCQHWTCMICYVAMKVCELISLGKHAGKDVGTIVRAESIRISSYIRVISS